MGEVPLYTILSALTAGSIQASIEGRPHLPPCQMSGHSLLDLTVKVACSPNESVSRQQSVGGARQQSVGGARRQQRSAQNSACRLLLARAAWQLPACYTVTGRAAHLPHFLLARVLLACGFLLDFGFCRRQLCRCCSRRRTRGILHAGMGGLRSKSPRDRSVRASCCCRRG
jgi:hypothetical protein